MKFRIFIVFAFLAVFMPFVTLSQTETEKAVFVPEEGIDGKDVIWWPTPNSLVKAMLDIAKVGPNDVVVDLGSGDGRIVIEAAKRGAKATGIEYNIDLVRLSEQRAREDGVSDKAKFLNMDLFEYDLSGATVVTMYLLTDLNMRLRPTLLDLKPGTRIVSNTFDLGDWKADNDITVETTRESTDGSQRSYSSRSLGYYWVVPAKVAGTWKFMDGQLNLVQTYQVLSGTYQNSKGSFSIEDGKMSGNDITFHIQGVEYKGTLKNNQFTGTYSEGNSRKNWTAAR